MTPKLPKVTSLTATVSDARNFFMLFFFGLCLAGCGAGTIETKTGTGGTGEPPPPLLITEPATATAALTGVNPINLGGYNMTDTTTTVLLNATPQRSSADLRLGMLADAVGGINLNVGEGSATTAIAQSTVRGPVVSVDAANKRVTVLGQIFTLDQNTVLDNMPSLAGLNVGERVEIYALPLGQANNFLATRFVRIGTVLANEPVEILGNATNISGTQLQVLGITVNAQSAELAVATPAGFGTPLTSVSAITPDSRVRVIGTLNQGTLVATRVITGLSPRRSEGQLLALNGPLQTAKGAAMRLLDTDIDANALSANLPAGLVVGARVQVRGRITGKSVNALDVRVYAPGELISYTLDGGITDFVSSASFRVRGELINATTAQFISGTAGDLAAGKRVKIKGTAGTGWISATEVTLVP